MVAQIMALGRAMPQAPEPTASGYETRGVISLWSETFPDAC
jgi:hypothetical protein